MLGRLWKPTQALTWGLVDFLVGREGTELGKKEGFGLFFQTKYFVLLEGFLEELH